MAEPDSDPRNTMEDEDLEDGEIETDEENDVVVVEAKPAKPIAESTKKSKASDEESKKTSDAKAKNDRNSQASDNSAKTKKSGSNDTGKDDFMGEIENALAMALKKDGIAPKPVKISTKHSEEKPKEAKEQKEPKTEASSSGKSSKHKRKHAKDKESQRKKARLTEEDGERTYHSNESEEFDDYEMMNVRGGSPPLHGGPQSGSQKQNYYDSDASYASSFESDTGDHRRRHRSKRRGNDRNSRRNHRGGNSKRDHKRRRDDSDDDNGGHGNNTGGGGGGNNRSNNNNNQPRKAELCKFYLMECCAKGEKCLYMHGDFPCKFYYLGMKNHNRENCKFSHGKPLTDQLRAVLLKHLETAPKEILGDFPRIARENAINMINAQHQKLLVKFGMEPEPSTNTSNTTQASKLPSLLDINLSKYQPPSNNDLSMSMGKKDKPRKSRWCDQRTNESDTDVRSGHTQNSNNSQHSDVNSSNENDIKLSSLTGTLNAEQVEKLAKLGIETISQVTQLTVLQVIELGLSIALISELQLKAVQLQQNKQKMQQQQQQKHQQKQQQKRKNSTSSESPNPFSTKPNEAVNQDQDMRIPLNPMSKSEPIVELSNQDVDMRILPIPQRSGSDQSKYKKSDSYSKNTQSEKSNEQATSRKIIDYSQYLKDANIDLNQSDLEDPIGEALKEKRKGYDSDEDEANPLVIEEEDMNAHDESQSENDTKRDPEDRLKSSTDDGGENNTESTRYDSPRDGASNSLPSPDSNFDPANPNDDHILPAFYAPTSIFPPSVTNKIDLSSSVSQYLNKETLVKDIDKKTDSYIKQMSKSDGDLASDPNDDDDSTGSRSPAQPTSFYSRQIPETSHPAPQALDEKPSPSVDYDSASEVNARNVCVSPPTAKPVRKSIYEMSSDDEDNNADDTIRSPSDDDSQDSRKQNPFSVSKDKDMRISAMFMDKDYSNGDIDLRLPFKPVMANYIPATEIDASITSHAPMVYEVKEVDIPKPDYSELRKSIPTHENTLDPRLRRILRIKDDYPEPETNFTLSAKASPFSPPHEPETTSVSTAKIDTVSDPRRQRIDPRRPNAHMMSSHSNTSSSPTSSVLNKPSPRSPHLDIQNILQKSNWYKDCSSKQKIMVNQQLAIVSTELKKFHADPSENKIFDLKFIIQNPLLQEVLTNLGIFISDDGEFVQLDQPSLGMKEMQARNAAGNSQGLVDLMSIPMDFDMLRNQQQQEVQQQLEQQAALQAQINALGPRFLGKIASPQWLQNLPGVGVSTPGLLGIAPNMEAFGLIQNANQNAAFFNQRGSSGGNGGGGGGGGGGNRRTGGGMRRNQFDRNNVRRK